MNIFQKYSKRDMQNAHPLTQFANIEENSLTTTLLPQKE